MSNRLQRILQALDLEERILNGSSFVGLLSVFFPWISGEWLGGNREDFTGLEFFHSFLGFTILLLHALLLAITFIPLLGGPVLIKKRHREAFRLALASQATILSLAALTVLTNITFEATRMEIRFGIYFTFVFSLIASIYAFLKLQEHRRQDAQNLFRHPEDTAVKPDLPEMTLPTPPPPPPPPPLEPEEHRVR